LCYHLSSFPIKNIINCYQTRFLNNVNWCDLKHLLVDNYWTSLIVRYNAKSIKLLHFIKLNLKYVPTQQDRYEWFCPPIAVNFSCPLLPIHVKWQHTHFYRRPFWLLLLPLKWRAKGQCAGRCLTRYCSQPLGLRIINNMYLCIIYASLSINLKPIIFFIFLFLIPLGNKYCSIIII